jgi:lipoprotein-anchoring transpeptidase ErfK/SrfK
MKYDSLLVGNEFETEEGKFHIHSSCYSCYSKTKVNGILVGDSKERRIIYATDKNNNPRSFVNIDGELFEVFG